MGVMEERLNQRMDGMEERINLRMDGIGERLNHRMAKLRNASINAGMRWRSAWNQGADRIESDSKRTRGEMLELRADFRELNIKLKEHFPELR
jgi:hypothetical protein